MPVPDVDNVALREACAASLYGFNSRYRHDDAFDLALASICAWAVTIDRYDDASVDVFTGDDVLTVSGRARPRAALDEISAVVSGDPDQMFHSLTSLGRPGAAPVVSGDPAAPPSRAWAGATLLTPHGVVLGSLNLWADDPVTPGGSARGRLPLLARAAMHVLDERQRIVARRAVPAAGPRVVVERRAPRRAPGRSG